MSKNKTDSPSYGKQFFSGVTVLALSTIIVKLIGLFYKIPMMAYLGAEGMGYFNSAYDIYSLFFVIATTGIPVAISILISENKTQGRINNVKRIFRLSIILLGIIGFVGTILMGVFHKQFASLINNDAAAYCILAISPTVLMICLSSAIRGYFQGNQIMIPTAISQIIEALGKLLLGLGFAIIAINAGHNASIAAAYAVLGLSLGVIISLLYLVIAKIFHKSKSNDKQLDSFVDSSSKIIKTIFNIAIPITISSTILSLSKVIDMTMILGRLNYIGYTQEQANAIYGSYSTMAVSIFNLPATLVSAIALPLVPLLASAVEANDKIKESAIISSSLKLTVLIAFPAGLGISVFSKPILSLLFASQEKEIEYTAPLLSLLGISIFLSSMITRTNAILQSYKQVKKPIFSMVIGTLVKIVSSFILIGIPSVNIYGAPISTFVSTLIIVALNLYFIARYCSKIDGVINLFVKPALSSILSMCLGVGIYLALTSISSSRIMIIVTILTVCLAYCICALKLKALNKDEIIMLPKGEKIYQLLTKIHLV